MSAKNVAKGSKSNKAKTRKCPKQKNLLTYASPRRKGFQSWEHEYEKSFAESLTKSNTKIAKELIKMFKTPFAPSKVTPRSDYFTYINNSWITRQEEMLKKDDKYYVQVDNFRVVQEKVYYELIDIVNDYAKTEKTRKAKLLDNVHKSFLKLNPKSAKNHIANTVQMVTGYIEGNDLIKFLARMNQSELVSWSCPISWLVLPDEKNSQIYKNYISSHQLSIYDYDIYLDVLPGDPNGTYKNMVKKEYFKYIDNIFNACLGPNSGYSAQDIWDVECLLLTAFECEDIEEAEDGYNLIDAKDCLPKYGFDWEKFAKELGFAVVPQKILINNLNFVKCVMKILNENWNSPKWKGFWLYLYFRQIIRFHKEWKDIWFNFNGKILLGQTVNYPEELYPIFGLSACFNTLLTDEYVKRNPREAEKEYIGNMAVDMKAVFIRKVKRNTWLSPSTKKYALMKLEHIDLVVGVPKRMRADALLDYTEDDPWGNLMLLSKWRTEEFVKLDGQQVRDIPAIDWNNFKLIGYQSYIVNAFYTPTQNAIYIPLAYLQKPFIDLDERGIEYNLAHVGYTLGHELSHSLDDLGSQYDHLGNLHNWWTPEDKKKFNAKVQDVIKQYEQFAKYDGIDMDGSLSTGENLADISGMAICEEYLRDFQDKNEDIVPVRSLSFEAFYCYLAVQARQKISNKAFAAQLKTNPHPMDKYRTNCPLARLELFKSIFNIKKGDKMYWPNNDTIW
jgi:putative endopeptidase